MVPRKRIMLITLRADHGGGPRHVDLLIEGLKDSCDLWLACPDDKPYYDKWLGSGVKGICLLPHRRFEFRAMCRLLAFVARNRISVLHSHGKGAGIYSRMAKLLLPGVTVVHTLHGLHIGTYSGIKRRLYLFFEKIASLLTARIVNVSNGELSLCLRHKIYGRDKAVVIFNGIPPAPSGEGVRTIAGGKRIVVATITRFEAVKNMQLAFEIARRMSEDKEFLFLWVGDGDDAPLLQERAASCGLDNILFAGFQNDVGAYLAQSDIYLSTSLREGLPIAVIEALSFGIPVVASNVVGNDEVVQDGYNGLLFDLNEPEAAVRHLRSLEEQALRSRFGANAKAHYQAHFTLERMVASVQKIYDNA